MNDSNVSKEKQPLDKKVKILLIIFCSILVIFAIFGGSVYGAVRGCAKNNQRCSLDEAERMAQAYVLNKYESEGIIVDTNKKLKFQRPVTNSYYIYEIEIGNIDHYKIIIQVDSRNNRINENTSYYE